MWQSLEDSWLNTVDKEKSMARFYGNSVYFTLGASYGTSLHADNNYVECSEREIT